jgi:hypothetical protein
MKAAEPPRSAIELIEEMDAAVKVLGGAVLLIVGFPDKSGAVFSGFPDRLQTLEKLLHEGGRPVGMFNFKVVNGERLAYYYILDECVEISWATPYMEAFVDAMNQSEEGEIITVGMKDFLIH